MVLPDAFVQRLREVVAPEYIRQDAAALDGYGADALLQVHRPDIVVIPANTSEISRIAALCNEHRVPLVVRGAGTGYTGGAVPTAGGGVPSVGRPDPIPPNHSGN